MPRRADITPRELEADPVYGVNGRLIGDDGKATLYNGRTGEAYDNPGTALVPAPASHRWVSSRAQCQHEPHTGVRAAMTSSVAGVTRILLRGDGTFVLRLASMVALAVISTLGPQNQGSREQVVITVPILVTVRVLCSHIESLSALGEFLAHSNTDNGASNAGNTDKANGTAPRA